MTVSASSLAPAAPDRMGTATRRWLLHIGLTLGALVMAYPLIWLVASSFKPSDEIFSDFSLWPKTFTLSNYVYGWLGAPGTFGRPFLNSALLCLGCVIGNTISCSMAAYAFARLRFPMRSLWFALMLGMIMLPSQVTLIPQYSMFYWLGWIGTYLPLIVPKLVAVDAFFVFLMVQFIRGIPRELDEAAWVDGCGPVRIYFLIILPLLRPALATTAVFTFLWTYNDFFSQLVYLSDPIVQTIPVALRSMIAESGPSNYGGLMAMSVATLVPVFLLFLFFQRQLVAGVAHTGLKG